MIAVDTNVVVRFLTRDDEAQFRKARALVSSHPIWVPLTVMLETEWVLRALYEYDRESIGQALSHFSACANVHVENPRAVLQALAWMEQGMDFADALHVCGLPAQVVEFRTFDRKLRAHGKSLALPVNAP